MFVNKKHHHPWRSQLNEWFKVHNQLGEESSIGVCGLMGFFRMLPCLPSLSYKWQISCGSTNLLWHQPLCICPRPDLFNPGWNQRTSQRGVGSCCCSFNNEASRGQWVGEWRFGLWVWLTGTQTSREIVIIRDRCRLSVLQSKVNT